MSKPQLPPTEPSHAAIREQMQRILANAPFDRSPVLSRFLNHVVEHALTSEAAPLKEYTIGLEVFDRADDFDPRIDSIVRVQARRLRDALAAYYQDEGRHDAVHLDMPKGHYGILARHAGEVSAEAPRADAGAQRSRDAVFSATSLPAARTPLIGRELELDQLRHSLKDEGVRMLTVTGVGGSGKTRLALAVADATRDTYPAGVFFLDLSAVTERAVLVSMLADVFSVRHAEQQKLLQALAESMRGSLSQPLLLVMDNMEGVLDAADVLGELLDATTMITILVTSRVALRLYGEHEYPLAPLAVPDQEQRNDAASLASVAAIQLFLARAAAANPRADFKNDMGTLAELCVRLDGLPLAIELVAAQAGTLTPEHMLDRFTGHLDLPENPARDAPSRQRTLRRTIDWSYELLNDPSRLALRRLSVFAGGFTLEAAVAVADAQADLGSELMPALTALVSMGLLYFRATEDEPRYAMLETLRAYGRERLNASGEDTVVHKAHAAYFLVLAEEGVGRLNIAQREAWLAQCDREQDNFRLALEFLLRGGPQAWALRLGHALFFYWERREKLTEGRHLLKKIAAAVKPEADRALWAKVAVFVATMDAFQGNEKASMSRLEEVLEMYRGVGDRKGEAEALNALGVHERLRGNDNRGREWLAQGLELSREVGDQNEIAAALSNLAQCEMHLRNTRSAHAMLTEARALFAGCDSPVPAAWCLNHLGDVARLEGDVARAFELYVEAEVEFDSLGDLWGIARTRDDRSRLAIESGDYGQAGPLLLQVLGYFESLNHQRGMAAAIESIAGLALALGHPELAIKLVAAARSRRAAVGYSPRPDDVRDSRDLLDRAQAGLDVETCNALHDVGWNMTPADVAGALRVLMHESGI